MSVSFKRVVDDTADVDANGRKVMSSCGSYKQYYDPKTSRMTYDALYQTEDEHNFHVHIAFADMDSNDFEIYERLHTYRSGMAEGFMQFLWISVITFVVSFLVTFLANIHDGSYWNFFAFWILSAIVTFIGIFLLIIIFEGRGKFLYNLYLIFKNIKRKGFKYNLEMLSAFEKVDDSEVDKNSKPYRKILDWLSGFSWTKKLH